MEKKYYIYIFILTIAVIVVLSALTYDKLEPIPIPAVAGIGMLIIFVFSLLPLLGMYIRSKTTVVITNCGHFTIRPDDIKHVSLDIGKGKGKSLVINLTLMLTGSLHMDNFWTGGGNANDPVLVFISTYERKIGKCYVSEANLNPADINNELFHEVRRYLMKLDSGRVTAKTPLLFGLTSPIDGSCTLKNLFLEEKVKDQETIITTLKNNMDILREQIKKGQELNRPIILEPSGTVKE